MVFRGIKIAGIAVALVAAACGAHSGPSRPRPGCATRTSLGAVAGTARAGVCVFRGIPYAAPPVGDRRFRPPGPVRPWQGTLHADDGTRVCPQERDRLSEDYPDRRTVYTDEDCLYLNVWTPRPDHAKRPVIVFVHGGAARFGTANEPRYDGARVSAAGDAVVVTFNYRLGVLGWSELGGLDPSYRGSGNNGLRDQIAALTWVRRHAADFGGDPDRVTAVGESEGAFSLSALLATDHPERLFRRVVLQSGSGALVHSAALERRLAAGLPARSIGRLTAMPVRRLLDLQERAVRTRPGATGGALYFGPYVDGALVRGPVTERVAAGNARGVDLLIGTDRDEVNFFGQFDPKGLDRVAAEYDGFFPPRLAARRPRMTAVYRAGRTRREATLAMFTDQGLRVPAIRLAEAQGRWRPTYVYEFDWAPAKGAGAVHTIELPFVFGTLRFTGVQGGAEALRTDRARLTGLSDQMIDAWTSFARTGVPRSAVDWPAYRVPRRTTMVWDLRPHTAEDPRGAERALWDGHPFGPLER
jgi:para-nitrobenzyl esterase